MPTTSIQGGYVETWFASDGANGQLQLHAQKYTTTGQKVGAEFVHLAGDQTLEVVATYNAGYVLGFNDVSSGNALFVPFDADGLQQQLVAKGASDFNLAASPDGGFLISWMGPANWAQSPSTPHVPRFALYDAWGGARISSVQVNGELPAIVVQADGDYGLAWRDGDYSHSLEIDPQSPPSIQPVYGPSGFGIIDDVAPATGGTYNVPINDTSPQVMLIVTQTGYFDLSIDKPFAGGDRRIEVTAEDVSLGQKIIDIGSFGEGRHTGSLHFTATNGISSQNLGGFFFTVDLTPPPAPTIAIYDDAGPQTGLVFSGESTDDATPSVRILVPEGVKPEDYYSLQLDGQPIRTDELVQYGSVSRGYIEVNLNRSLVPGTYTLTADLHDGARNASPAPIFTFTVTASPTTSAPQIYGATPRLGMVQEGHLPNGTAPDAAALTQTAVLRLYAPAGVDDFTLASQPIIRDGVFTASTFPITFGEISVKSFDAASGELSLTYTLKTSVRHTSGPEIASVYLPVELTDQAGGRTTSSFIFDVANDRPILGDDTDTAKLGQPATGNLLTDAAPGDAGDTDQGADRMGADGGRLVSIIVGRLNDRGPRDETPDANGDLQVAGKYGVLTVNLSGDYRYVVNADAPSNVFDSFDYYVHDGDVNDALGQLTIHVTEGAPPPDPNQGEVLTSDQYGDSLAGGAGPDTLNAGQGPDQLTGGGGADRFVWKDLPWNAGAVTDFVDGTDKLDLTALYTRFGYGGTDPVADRWVSFESDGGGGTRVMFDTDGPAPAQSWSYLITTLKAVAPSSLSAGDLVGGDPGGGETEPSSGQVLYSDQYGDSLVGGSGNDTLHAGQGPDQLTGGGGEDTFAFPKLPWNAGAITDFTPGSDLLDLSALFREAGYAGPDPIASRWLILQGDGADTRVYVDVDGPDRSEWPFLITTLRDVAPSELSPTDWIT